jgi:predicted ATPase
MKLLERDEFLRELNNQLQNAVYGEGQVAVIGGDAGIGKTSLVESFTKQTEDKARIFWGACDDLFTPRPLAPLYDIAGGMKSRIIEKLEQAHHARLYFLHSLMNCMGKTQHNCN